MGVVSFGSASRNSEATTHTGGAVSNKTFHVLLFVLVLVGTFPALVPVLLLKSGGLASLKINL